MKKQIMLLKLFVDSDDDFLKQLYESKTKSHNEKMIRTIHCHDAGFDLFAPIALDTVSPQVVVNFHVKCSATNAMLDLNTNEISIVDAHTFTPYYMYMRSSMSRTSLRLANCQGVIDAGYRGNLIGVFDCVPAMYMNTPMPEKYSRILQICSPRLEPVFVQVVHSADELGMPTERGEGGFGSTNTNTDK